MKALKISMVGEDLKYQRLSASIHSVHASLPYSSHPESDGLQDDAMHDHLHVTPHILAQHAGR